MTGNSEWTEREGHFGLGGNENASSLGGQSTLFFYVAL